jgi:hypothetical protein
MMMMALGHIGIFLVEIGIAAHQGQPAQRETHNRLSRSFDMQAGQQDRNNHAVLSHGRSQGQSQGLDCLKSTIRFAYRSETPTDSFRLNKK